jgi:methyl-accepting chemotaxis protein
MSFSLNFFPHLKIRSKIFIASAIPLAFVMALGAICYHYVEKITQTSAWVDHTHKVIEQANQIVASAVDMETGMRGYLLAGKEEFLAPYKSGEEAVYTQLSSLKETVSDNPRQVKRLEEVEQTLKSWQSNVSNVEIDLRREINGVKTMDHMASLIGEARGKEYFDKFRSQIALFKDREEKLLTERERAFRESISNGTSTQSDIRENMRWVEHTYNVLGKADTILAAAVDMETGMRGFLLAGKDEFLEPYNNGQTKIFDTITELKQTVSDNPPQVQLLSEIEGTIRSWEQDVTNMQIGLRREITNVKTMDNLADLVGQAQGKQYFDRFRQQIETFKNREQVLLRERNAELNSALDSGTATQQDITNSLNWVIHTNKVLLGADAILAAATDMETGMRGFLLAGKDEFLEPYNRGEQRLYSALDQMKQTVSDNPAQVMLLGEMDRNMRAWQSNVTESQIAMRRDISGNKRMFHMAEIVGEARGKQYFDKFRQIMSDFIAEERQLIATRQQSNTDSVQATYTAIFLCSGVALVLGGGLALLIGGGISAPVKRMTNNMSRLAEGDTSIQVRDLGRRDEVGEMAQALEVFKQNRVQAEQAEIQEKQAIQELSEVVSACSSGDFTKRLETRNKSGVFVDLSKGINNISESVENSLKEIKDVLVLISQGNLNQKVSGQYQGIFSDIKECVNHTVDQLQDTISQVVTTSNSVNNAATEISTGSTDLSRRVEQQAATLEETAAAIEEMTSSIQSTAENARKAYKVVGSARDNAESSSAVVEQAVNAMSNINTSSNQISQIIGVIDEIAFQTNLLALNAGVEAARAGDAGRGFAVVASEVRALAQRSSDAAKEIKDLITASSRHVSEGVEHVGQTGVALKEILNSINNINQVVSEITSATQEQSTGLSEINSAVSQLDQVTQHNAAMVEETTAASQTLMQEARDLNQITQKFVLSEQKSNRYYGSPAA